jgi:glutamyl-tRNA reductase
MEAPSKMALQSLACLHVDVHQLGLESLEAIARELPADPALVRIARAAGASEVALLRTCNRIELYLRAPGGEDRDLFLRRLRTPLAAIPFRASHAEAAARRLLRVSCSLESMTLGEDQILGQVRAAFVSACDHGHAGSLLRKLFPEALRLGKRVRGKTLLARLGTSIPRLALTHLRPQLHATGSTPLALVGSGALMRDVLAIWPSKATVARVIVSRDPRRAQLLAGEIGAAVQSLPEFLASADPLAGMICATTCREPVIGAELVRRRLPPSAGIADLGLPRNVEPEAGAHARLADLVSLQDLASCNRTRLDATLREIDGWIEAGVERLQKRSALPVGGPT